MEYTIKQQDKFRYIEEGQGEPLVLLHGLFGAMSNFTDLIEYFRHHNKVVVPLLPLFESGYSSYISKRTGKICKQIY